MSRLGPAHATDQGWHILCGNLGGLSHDEIRTAQCVISVEHMNHFSEIKLCGQHCVQIRMSVGEVILLSFDQF